MRLLIITRAPLSRDNSTGNTCCEFFESFSDVEIYSLCLREAPTVDKLSKKNFYISERQLIKSLINKNEPGAITTNSSDCINESLKEENMYNAAKKYQFTILKFARELLWMSDRWKNSKLDSFLKEASPDVIFFPDFPCVYAHKVLQYIKKRTNAKVAIFHADDCYTLKQYSFSILYWLYRFYQRKWVFNSVKLADYHYVISEVQKSDYDKAFNVNNKILTKFGDFNDNVDLKEVYNTPLQFIYTGNVGLNRWKSLALLAKGIHEINRDGIKVQLRIYTANNITNGMREALELENSSFIMGKASADEVVRIQQNADVLVHVESTDLKNRLSVRQSFSTKIVDYMKRGRAIFVVGPKEVASIKHLIDNNCALVADNYEETLQNLKIILRDKKVLNEYAIRAYDCGKKYHNKCEMLKILKSDLCGKKE